MCLGSPIDNFVLNVGFVANDCESVTITCDEDELQFSVAIASVDFAVSSYFIMRVPFVVVALSV